MATRKAGKIFVGVGGWNFAPWRGSFYPKGLTQASELHYASRELTSIEINSTFYGLQKPATFRKWHDETPDGFVFSVKAPRFVTNARASRSRRRASNGSSTAACWNSAPSWGRSIGSSPPSKPFDAQDLASFLELLPGKHDGRALRHALEVRDESFECAELSRCCANTRWRWLRRAIRTTRASRSAPRLFSYLRVMGTKASAPKGYAPAALARWRERAEELARDGDVFFYFISGAKERNPQAARALLAALEKSR